MTANTLFPATLAAEDWRKWASREPVRRWLVRLPRVATVLMTVLLVSLAADLTWMLLTPSPSQSGATTRNNTALAPKPQLARFRDVANLHLFGQVSGPRASAPVKQEHIPETNLRLTLLGVFASSVQENSYAIIADARNKEEYYRPGDQIEAGGSSQPLLVSVFPDHVVLERNGRREKLMLPSEPLKEAPPSTLPTTRQRSQAPAASTQKSDDSKNRGLRQVWEDLRKNPQEFWKQTRIEPVMDKDSNIQGYKLNHKDKALMSSLGIRSSDVITSINGMPLNDPSSFAQLQSLLSELQPFSVTLLRNGKEQTMDIQP